MAVPFVDYYKRHNISPVSQDIADLGMHFRRRRALYAHLGIPSALLKDKRILEFGPGSGHNALFTGSMEPISYVFVDGNPKGLTDTETMMKCLSIDGRCTFHESLIEDFVSDQKFDLVICEGLLPGQVNPSRTLRHVASFVDTGGILIVTCVDSISLISDLLRHYVGNLLVEERQLSFSEAVAFLVPVFDPHLKALEFASRPVSDWVADCVLQPLVGSYIFSIKDAIESLDADFDVLGVSPHFFSDWRWYKQIRDIPSGFNDAMKNSYEKYMHAMINHRSIPVERDVVLNRDLCDKAGKVCNIVLEASKSHRYGDCMHRLVEAVSVLKQTVGLFDAEASVALGDYLNVLKHKSGTDSSLVDFATFTRFWGRGQQYLSFMQNGYSK